MQSTCLHWKVHWAYCSCHWKVHWKNALCMFIMHFWFLSVSSNSVVGSWLRLWLNKVKHLVTWWFAKERHRRWKKRKITIFRKIIRASRARGPEEACEGEKSLMARRFCWVVRRIYTSSVLHKLKISNTSQSKIQGKINGFNFVAIITKARRPESACNRNNLLQKPNRAQKPKARIRNPNGRVWACHKKNGYHNNPISKIQNPKPKIRNPKLNPKPNGPFGF